MFPCICGEGSTEVLDVVKQKNAQTAHLNENVKLPEASNIDTQKQKEKKTPWWYRLFGRPRKCRVSSVSKDNVIKKDCMDNRDMDEAKEVTQNTSTNNSAEGKEVPRVVQIHVKEAPNAITEKSPGGDQHKCLGVKFSEASNVDTKKEKKKLFGRIRNCHVFQTQEDNVKKKDHMGNPDMDEAKDVKYDTNGNKTKNNTEKGKKVPKVVRFNVRGTPIPIAEKSLGGDQHKCLGFPNPASSCYMNACLQSLLTLETFVRCISSQQQVWGSVPAASLLRSFLEVKNNHDSSNLSMKSRILCTFKDTVSAWAPEFSDLMQKDAHEFLVTVFDQIRTLDPKLQKVAKNMGKSYTCPVRSQVSFEMENTRTCRSCGVQSKTQEVFTNLSLDLLPECETVEDLLAKYLSEDDIQFRCECGGNLSGQSSAFTTFPKVLVLHLKRFRLTPSWQLQKDHHPIHLNRDLVVSTKQEGSCYSLVSIISHLGSSAVYGHYVSDGKDPDDKEGDPTDCWFTYDDLWVDKTTGATVCEDRQKTSYILFYNKQD